MSPALHFMQAFYSLLHNFFFFGYFTNLFNFSYKWKEDPKISDKQTLFGKAETCDNFIFFNRIESHMSAEKYAIAILI